ncbi:MAG: hypothetical protein HY305_02070 [Sphingobacteriales bacterium]|nr:hypothetical protein [Sphingobacteriales bacterium]
MKNTSHDIITELQSLSPLLAGMERKNVFTVPQGYFDSIYDRILIALQKENVPEGYFDSLANNILAKIKAQHTTAAEELRNLSPMLYSIQNENVFTVPGGYFESLADEIINKQDVARIIALPKKRRRNTFIKYAIAAAVTGILAFGGYKFNENNTVTLASVATFSTATLDAAVEKGKNMNEVQFNEALDNLSSEEITSYLEKHNDESDVAVLTSGIEEKSLPAKDDYLLDEKTLDNYLQQTSTDN